MVVAAIGMVLVNVLKVINQHSIEAKFSKLPYLCMGPFSLRFRPSSKD